MRRRLATSLPLLVAALAPLACGPTNQYTPLDPDIDPVTEGEWYRPGVDATWQWQLLVPEGEAGIDTSYAVEAYDIDLFDTDAAQIAALQAEGHTVICYFSAGSWEPWRDDADDFLYDDIGDQLEGWAEERWLNIRSPVVAAIMRSRLDLAVDKGCDGVEPDNVDGYDNDTGFEITSDDQLAFNRTLANAAHERGLAVGLKNDLAQVDALVDYYDFSVNEQCHEYDECAALEPFTAAQKPVWNAEYVDADSEEAALAAAEDICPAALAADLRTLILPLDLDDSFRVSCD
ncbi:endo alpha-1,4 polygalactosaminidase [Pseudenhygromyxa sp. WMMC2535]|uniref:endo alpha-1,4 polygalactosaminidase n=1 Tax=Pseudenhygromyxa sp. WMMC2535 TaxID=2712867 RepID=UPI001557EBAE|nr:endo alpha-1,4 polygalactosaminidase [Pseudenhygromyxa sp. WMMC2535]NVB43361.1 endo alpha-1,4 polygalactosaminidase [Pseudenhygromyxa sp. WMMC2535]